jgi:hypothetical protein
LVRGGAYAEFEGTPAEAKRLAAGFYSALFPARRYFAAPILNILVPQTGQTPSVAGRPFFIVTCFESLISRWVLHFMQ